MMESKDFKQIDIIYLGLFRWNGPFSSISIALAKEFAKSNRIFYINHPYTVRDYFQLKSEQDIARKEDLRKNRVRFEQDPTMPDHFYSVIPPLVLPINWMPDNGFYDRWNRLNDKQIKRSIQQIIDQFQVKQYLFINCFDPYFGQEMPSSLPPLVNVYQCVDDLSQNSYMVKHGVRLEQQAIANADITMVTSNELHKICSQYSKEVHTLNNAADTNIFTRAITERFEKPAELATAKGKIIGFMGNLDNMRVDYQLFKAIATAYPNDTLLLIGPINNDEYKRIGLDTMPNIIFTGGKSIDELPQYMHYFDCALIPFLCNQITRSIYPLKINEYLAAGKAVVSTRFSVDIEGFAEHIYLADNHEEFIAHIGEAVHDNSAEVVEKRLAVAQSNTWESRVKEFWKVIQQYLEQKTISQTSKDRIA